MATGDNEQFLEALLADYQSFSTQPEVDDLRNHLISGGLDYTDADAVMEWYMNKIPRLVSVYDPEENVEVWMRNGKRVKPPAYDINKLYEVMKEGDVEVFIQALLDDYATTNTDDEVINLKNELMASVDYTDMYTVMEWYESKIISNLPRLRNVFLREFWVKDGEKVRYSWENVKHLQDAVEAGK